MESLTRGSYFPLGEAVAELIITHCNGTSTRHVLATEPLVVGRDAGCDAPVDDPSISRRHARFTPTTHGYMVEDLGSKNGTLVNDEPCQSRLLHHGDHVVIGSTLAVFQEEESRTSPPVTIADDAPTRHNTHYVSRDTQLNLSRQRLKMIYELSGRLTTLKGQGQLLEDALDICFEMLHFERGAVGVRRAHQRGLDWPVVRNLQGPQGELTISRTLLSRALEHGERAIFTEGDGQTADPTVSMVQHGIRSAMCVPLLHGEQVLGILYGDRVHSSFTYTDEDIDFLAGIAQQVSIGLINCRLVEEQQQMIRLNHDIDMARKIQTGLFPALLPDREGLRIAALNEPGQRVSGDYYDVIETADVGVWCLIADVTGEGMSAALLMANLQAAVRVTIDESNDPGELLARWNKLIHRNTDASRFITCLLARIDPQAREIRCATAGHFPPFITSPAGGLKAMETEPGYPLGVQADAEYVTATVRFDASPCMLFCYTDGVVEAMNAKHEPFGTGRLLAALSEHREVNPQSLVRHVRKQVANFVAGADQSDDITMLAAFVH